MLYPRINTMKNLNPLFAILAGVAVLVAVTITGCEFGSSDTQDYLIETIAMGIGYELAPGFEWTKSVDDYYNGIMAGKMSLDAAVAAEAYLRTKTHPLIANRLVTLAGKVGFSFDAGKIVGVEKVDIHLLQVAAQGFKMGVLLEGPQASAATPSYYLEDYHWESVPGNVTVPCDEANCGSTESGLLDNRS